MIDSKEKKMKKKEKLGQRYHLTVSIENAIIKER